MTFSRYTIFILVLLFPLLLTAQYSKDYGQRKKPKKKEIKAICPFSYHKKTISHGLGIRIGDPMGLSYKIYYKRRVALELTYGFGFAGLYSPIHRTNFDKIPEFSEFEYIAHNVDYSLAHQGRAILHNNLPGYHRLDWYVGLGYHARWYRLQYHFNFIDEDGRQDVGSAFHDDVDLGPEAMIGFEFDYPDVPITVYAEFGTFYNMAGVSTFWRAQGALGARYDF